MRSNTCYRFGILVALCALIISGATVAGHSATNLAPLGTASASTIYSPAYDVSFINDNDLNTRWSGAGGDTEKWCVITWATPQTFNKVVMTYLGAWHPETTLKVEVWDGAGWVEVAFTGDGVNAVPLVTTLEFPYVTTTKIRVSPVETFMELEVFLDGIVGQVTDLESGKVVPYATVAAGDVSTVADASGKYKLNVADGTYDVVATKGAGYEVTSGVAAGPDDGALVNIVMDTYNLALSATASAEQYHSIYYPYYVNDGDLNTRWSTYSGMVPVQLEWTSPKTFNSVVITYLPAWHPETSVEVQVWDGTNWITVASRDEGIWPLPLVTKLDFSAQTTSKMRITPMETFMEMEVYSGETIQGYVTDADTSAGIGCVSILGGFSEAATDDTGYYSVVAPVGSVNIRASADIYEDYQATVANAAGGITHSFAMTQKPGNLAKVPGVVVTASSGDNPAGANDANPCTFWESAGDYDNGWLTIEWPAAQTIDTVEISRGYAFGLAVDAQMPDGSMAQVASLPEKGIGTPFPVLAEFAPITTSKIRLRGLGMAREVGVYKRSAETPGEINLTGAVTNTNGQPVINAEVTVGSVTVMTSNTGNYYTSVPTGSADITVSRLGYITASQSAAIPETGTATVDFVLSSRNIAPQATATSLSAYPGYPETYGNDDNLDTRWSNAGGSSGWYQLEWTEPVVINDVKVHQLAPSDGSFGMFGLRIEYADNLGNWHVAGSIEGLTPPNPAIVDVQFGAISTNKIRLFGCITFWEVEVLAVDELFQGSVGGAKSVPDGGAAMVTGVVTAVFDDCGYVEDADRCAAFRVQPVTQLGVVETTSPNLSFSGTFSSDTEYYGYPAVLANDGNLATRWSANVGPPGYLQCDWATAKNVNRVVLHMETYYWNQTTGNQVQYKDGAGNWVTIKTFDLQEWDQTVNFPTVNTTAIRVTGMVSITEMELFYLETNYSGIYLNQEVSVLGTVTTIGNERVLLAGQTTVIGGKELAPLGMANRSIPKDASIIDELGLGLLVTTWGNVTAISGGYVYVDDGSGLASDVSGKAGVKAGPFANPGCNVGDFVRVNGIAGVKNIGGVSVKTIRPRVDTDLLKLN